MVQLGGAASVMIDALLMEGAIVCVSACRCFFKRQQIRSFFFVLFGVHLFSVGVGWRAGGGGGPVH